MSPEKARVAIFEDKNEFTDLYETFLEMSGHTVVASATNFLDAKKVVDEFDKLDVQVALVDGTLSTSHDGQLILDVIKEKFPQVKTIGMSADRFPGTDVDLGKENLSSVGEVVTEI